MTEIHNIVNGLQKHKATGTDKIPNEAAGHILNATDDKLARLYNRATIGRVLVSKQPDCSPRQLTPPALEGTQGQRKTTIGGAQKVGQVIACKQDILRAVSRYTSGKVQFNREDRETVMARVNEMTDIVLGLLETQTDTETEGEWRAQKRRIRQDRTKQTYADVIGQGNSQGDTTDGWKTPERKDRLTTLIQETAQEEARQTGGIRGFAKTNAGQLAIHFKDGTQQKLIDDKIRTRPEIQIKPLQRTNPKLLITGIMKGYTDDELMDAMITENKELRQELGDNIKDKLKVVRRTTCINETKENVTMEATPEAFRTLVKKGKIYIDLRRGFKCHKFGHPYKYCTERARCHVCGGPHEGRQRTSGSPDCPNCASQGTPRDMRHHTARDRLCPVYPRRQSVPRSPVRIYKKGRMEAEKRSPAKQLSPQQQEKVASLIAKVGEILNEDEAGPGQTSVAGWESGMDSSDNQIGQQGQRKTTTGGAQKVGQVVACKQDILRAVSRYTSGKVQFNRDDRETVIARDTRRESRPTTISFTQIARQIEEQKREMQALTREIRELKKDGMADTMKGNTTEKKNRTKEGTRTKTGQTDDRPRTDNVPMTDTQTDTETEGEWRAQKRRTRQDRTKKTYADAIGQGNSQGDTTDGWKTPERKDRLTTLVQVPEGQRHADIIKTIKETAQEEARQTGGIRGFAKTNAGQLAIHYKDRTQQKLIDDKIKTRPELQIKPLQRTNPKLLITGVMKGYTDDELMDAIITENKELQQELGDNIKDKLKVVRRATCINQSKENVTMEATPEAFRTMVKRGKIYIDLTEIYIRKEVNVALCFKCHKFGHPYKYCTERARCHVCGGPHEGRQCTSGNPDCPNCASQGTPRDMKHHTARDRLCPVYQRKARQYQQTNVNYGSNTNRQT
ncbi:hypothetical protein HUJ05_013292 [Dendroctonus ponderosae]|nr:hypothetical protein HUJ05_013292 [Dendroctonus ponderosae]